MTVNTGYTSISMNTCRPCLKIWVLCLQHRSLGIRMNPILLETASLLRLIILVLTFWVKTEIPREGYTSIFLGKVILNMALTAYISTHFIIRSIIYINASALHSLNKGRIIHSQTHSLWVMTGNTAKPAISRNTLCQLCKGLSCIAPAHFLIENIHCVWSLAGNAASLLTANTLAVQNILTSIDMSTWYIVLNRELIAFPQINCFRLLR